MKAFAFFFAAQQDHPEDQDLKTSTYDITKFEDDHNTDDVLSDSDSDSDHLDDNDTDTTDSEPDPDPDRLNAKLDDPLQYFS